LLFRDAGLQPGIHVQLHRGRDVREVAVHAAGLFAAEEAMAPGHPAGGALQDDTLQAQAAAGHQCLFVGHHAVVHVEHHLRGTVSHSLSKSGGFRVRLHCGHQYLHVRLWRHQILFAIPLRIVPIPGLRAGCGVHDTRECGHRECGRHLGLGGQEAQVLCGPEGCARTGDCLGYCGTGGGSHQVASWSSYRPPKKPNETMQKAR